jgi:hypothetical protein
MQNVALRWHVIPPFLAFASTALHKQQKKDKHGGH